MDVTSHLVASIRVFRWRGYDASFNSVLCVLPVSKSCLYYQLVASWCLSDGNEYWVLDLVLLLLNTPFHPLRLSYTTPGIFFFYWCLCFGFLLSSSNFSFSMLDLNWFLIPWIIIIIISLSPITGLFIHGFLLRDISVHCYCHIYQYTCFLFLFVCNYYYCYY